MAADEWLYLDERSLSVLCDYYGVVIPEVKT
jgi:hypothetical protein